VVPASLLHCFVALHATNRIGYRWLLSVHITLVTLVYISSGRLACSLDMAHLHMCMHVRSEGRDMQGSTVAASLSRPNFIKMCVGLVAKRSGQLWSKLMYL
jgi:cell division FtsZ-interacting protein ZapD